jgi:superfamily II DNA or RNA helicase
LRGRKLCLSGDDVLRDLNLENVYDSSSCHLVRELISPLMAASTQYMRGVGYFSSGWLREAAPGIVALIENGGSARIITSPILSDDDWTAFRLGGQAISDEALHASLQRSIEDIERSLESDTRNCLAWLVADGLIEFRFAVPRPGWQDGDYHDKVWVFGDTVGDHVALHGSFNDSVKGTLNGEAVSVFRSWDEGQISYVSAHTARLETLWKDESPQFTTKTIPDAIKEAFIKLRTTSFAPYSVPGRPEPSVPVAPPALDIREAVTLRPFQVEALANWEAAGRRGILAMATGTGKTFTALTAAAQTHARDGRLAMVVTVPYLHLVEQWRRHMERFGFAPILCSGSHPGWRRAVRGAVRDFRIGLRDNVCMLAVHDTAASSDFVSLIEALPQANTLVIGDEVHALGAPGLQSAMLTAAGMHLGLSATPRRWFDPEGTAALLAGFGDVVFEFGIDEAIQGGYLTPYEYHPELIELSSDEAAQCAEIASKLARLPHSDLSDREKHDAAKWLLLQRARIVWSASGKLPRLLRLLKDRMDSARQEGARPGHILIYCAPGEHRDVLRSVANLGYRCQEFVHTVPMAKRQTVLDRFEAGEIEVLVAVNCLDQGVDVPATRTAYFLASTTNPMQFVQRRGRVLRLCAGKQQADVTDFVVVPPVPSDANQRDGGIGLLRREMPRFAEFSRSANNSYVARSAVFDILDAYGTLDMLDITPWDLYAETVAAGFDAFASDDPLVTGEEVG